MTREDIEPIQAHLAEVVFLLEWYDKEGRPCQGTGFFIDRDGTALTAHHNLSPESIEDPGSFQAGRFRGQEVAFQWVAESEADRAWQQKHDIAILRAESPPPDLRVVVCYSLSSRIKENRGSKWAEHEVAMLGHPKKYGFAQNTITGRVDRVLPIRDFNLQGDGYRVSDAIQIGTDSSIENKDELSGMSGSPLYDLTYRGIVGLLLAADKHAAATELWPVAEYWPGGKKIMKPLPVAAPPSPMWRWLLLVPLAAAAFWWYLQRPAPIPKQLAVKIERVDSRRQEELREDTRFTLGERVRFRITPSAAGYLYVVDQELNRNGDAGPPELIFPTKTTGMGRNRVSAGQQIPFPAADETPPYVEPKPENGNTDYGGELLTVLIYREPLKIDLQSDPIPLSPGQFPFDTKKPRIFGQPSASATDVLAMRQIRVAVHPASE